MAMLRAVFVVSVIVLTLGCSDGEKPGSTDEDLFSPAVFADPPAEFGPQARWWWPGGAIDDVTLREELTEPSRRLVIIADTVADEGRLVLSAGLAAASDVDRRVDDLEPTMELAAPAGSSAGR